MQKHNRTPPHLGWKLYFLLLLGATVLGLAELRWAWLEILNYVANIVGLVGLFGYAWAVRVPGSSRMWRWAGLLMGALLAINIIAIALRLGNDVSPTQVAVAVVLVILYMVPNAVAMLRYARDLETTA